MKSHYSIKCRSFIPLKYDLFFIIILECIDAFAPFWHEFKNSITVKIRLVHLHPFTNSYFKLLITVELVTSQVWLEQLQISLLQGVILRHDDANPRSARWTRVDAVISLGACGPSILLFGPLKRHFGGHWFHSGEEVQMGICEWLQMQEPNFLLNWNF